MTLLPRWPSFSSFSRRRAGAPAENTSERDEGEYAYAGQLLLDGIPLKMAYNMKSPGNLRLARRIMAVFDKRQRGFIWFDGDSGHAGAAVLVACRLLDLPHATWRALALRATVDAQGSRV